MVYSPLVQTATHAEFQRELDAGNLRGAGSWLVEHCSADVLNLCAAMVRDRALAEDLAQDAFGKAFAGLVSFRGEASPRTWLLAIARNRCLDHLRRAQRHEWVVKPDSEASEQASSDAPLPADLCSNRADVARALDSLDETQRAMIVLRYRHDLDYDELADVFGIKAGTARMRVSRALARMRRELQKAHEFARPPAAIAPAAAPMGARLGSKRGAPASRRFGQAKSRRPAPHAPGPRSAPGSAPAPPPAPGEAFANALQSALATAHDGFRHRLSSLLSAAMGPAG